MFSCWVCQIHISDLREIHHGCNITAHNRIRHRCIKRHCPVIRRRVVLPAHRRQIVHHIATADNQNPFIAQHREFLRQSKMLGR